MAVVVITGASSGIGEAAARLLAARGHRLVLGARRLDRLHALAAELSGQTDVLILSTDVSQWQDLETLASRAVERFGRLDVWISNAGVGLQPPWWEEGAEAIQHVIDTNLTGAILGARAALPQMIRQGRGHLINIGSVAGWVGVSGVYSATKFGLRGHTESLRREAGRYGVRVSLVTPGFIRTEMTAAIRFPMPGPETVARVIARLIERPRREVVVPGWYRLLIGLNRLSPGLIDRLFFLSPYGRLDRRRG